MKHYNKVILDTNVLLYDPNVIYELKNSEIIIPIVVLDELDDKKRKDTEIGRNARKVIRTLDELRELGSLYKGVPLKSKSSTIRIEVDIKCDKIPIGLTDVKIDNHILAVALMEKQKRGDVCVISKDINLRVKCDALDIKAEDYKKSSINNLSDVYNGYVSLNVTKDVIDKFYVEGFINYSGLINNQFVVLKNDKQSATGKYIDGKISKFNISKDIFTILPKNKEQLFAFNLLMDPSINLVTLSGNAGTGKSLIALAAGLQQVLDSRQYMRLIISKPNQPVGGKDRDLGFLPGTVAEKMEPWIAPFRDGLEFIFRGDNYEKYISSGTITIEAITYMRGRSIPSSFIIVDECQNLMPKELKTIITRVGFGSKIVLLGDISQIDNIFLDFATNGLTAVIETFKGNKIYGHVTLEKGERSELATLASGLL